MDIKERLRNPEYISYEWEAGERLVSNTLKDENLLDEAADYIDELERKLKSVTNKINDVWMEL